MNTFKIGDKVRAVKDCRNGSFKKGEIMTVEGIYHCALGLTGDTIATFDEIELIEAEPNQSVPKPFPTFEEFHEWYRNEQGNMQGVYHYFAQFGVREIFPEVGKEYEFSCSKAIWYKGVFQKYLCTVDGHTDRATHIRPIQPTRLEQLKARRSELSREELLELVELMEDK